MQPIPTETKGANRNIWGSFTGRRKTFTSEDLRRACHGLFIKLISKGSVENVKTHFFRAVGSGSFWWENVKIRQGAKRARFPLFVSVKWRRRIKFIIFFSFFFFYLSETGYIRDGAAIGFNPQDLRTRIAGGGAFDHRARRVGKVDPVGRLFQENGAGQRRRTGRRCGGTVIAFTRSYNPSDTRKWNHNHYNCINISFSNRNHSDVNQINWALGRIW